MKKGFTLVEVLAVIIILGVLAAIVVPVVQNSIDKSKTKLYNVAISEIEKGAKSYVLQYESEVARLESTGIGYITISELVSAGVLESPVVNPLTGENFSDSSAVKITELTNGNFEYEFLEEGIPMMANAPVLATGMTPIKWNGSTWEDTTISDAEWYSYTETDKKWANARTNDCSTPGDIETCSMWVWIPRYIYKISSGWHSNTTGTIDIQFSAGTDDNWNSSSIGDIDTGTTANASNNKWTNHPAFTFGSDEVTGIWVAKFDAVGTIDDIGFSPGLSILRSKNINDIFTAVRNMENNSAYGWGTSGSGLDTHLTKNVEWGAITYLSKSIYGKNTEEVWINPMYPYTSGCAGDSASSIGINECLHNYITDNGKEASTTGNEYGIYDMNGGAYDYTAAYINDASNTYLATYGLSLLNADLKYKDVYELYEDPSVKKGDAIYETGDLALGHFTWFGDGIDISHSFFIRGGDQGSTSTAGLYSYSTYMGTSSSHIGFRAVLLVDSGL